MHSWQSWQHTAELKDCSLTNFVEGIENFVSILLAYVAVLADFDADYFKGRGKILKKIRFNNSGT
jgi:hypothetical protein